MNKIIATIIFFSFVLLGIAQVFAGENNNQPGASGTAERNYMYRYKNTDVAVEIPKSFRQDGFIIKIINGSDVEYLIDKGFTKISRYKSKYIYLPEGPNTVLIDYFQLSAAGWHDRGINIAKVTFNAMRSKEYIFVGRTNSKAKTWAAYIAGINRSGPHKYFKPDGYSNESTSRWQAHKLSKNISPEYYVSAPRIDSSFVPACQ